MEWLQWLQRSPHPQLLDVVWCSAAVAVVVLYCSVSSVTQCSVVYLYFAMVVAVVAAIVVVVWYGVVWSGVVWCCVVWCNVG